MSTTTSENCIHNAVTLAIDNIWEANYILTTPEEKLRDETLGILISKYVEWDIDRLLTIVKSALENSNYHSLVEAIETFEEEDNENRDI
jgi:hypothetical protein